MKNKYKINEIFVSIQGEGYFSGSPALFIRFYGCNLNCSFCDTKYALTSNNYKIMTIKDILSFADKINPLYIINHIVLTGGEPFLQIDEYLLKSLKEKGYYIQIETNGTIEPDSLLYQYIDWITMSPKKDIVINKVNELKLLDMKQNLSQYETFHNKSLQPLYVNNKIEYEKNINTTIERVLTNKGWKLSLQLHKLIGIK